MLMWRRILLAFIFDRYIEEGNFALIRSNYKNLTDEEFLELEAVVEEAYANYLNLKGI